MQHLLLIAVAMAIGYFVLKGKGEAPTIPTDEEEAAIPHVSGDDIPHVSGDYTGIVAQYSGGS